MNSRPAPQHRANRFVATLACVALAGCNGEPAITPAAPPEVSSAAQLITAPSPLAPILAESLGAWQRRGTPRTWSAAALHDYVGPDAERWRQYDLVDAVVGSYDRTDGAIALVELYRFRAPSDAFGAYSTRRGFDARLVPVGNEGFITAHSLLSWKGNVVMRIVGTSSDTTALESLGLLAAESLPEGASKPSALGFLAGQPVVPGTEIWTREDAFGYAMFRNSALARVRVGNEVIDVLRHPCRNDREALATFEEFRGSVTLSAKTLDPVLGAGNEGFFAQDSHLANTLAFRGGSDVVVLRGPATPEALIRVAESLAANLRATAAIPAAPASAPVSVP